METMITLGLCAPDPHQGDDRPGPAYGEITGEHEPAMHACCVGGTKKLEGFWPKESQGKSAGKSELFPTGLPWLSPDALHPGWRLSVAGPEAHCRQACLSRSFLPHRETIPFLLFQYFPEDRVQRPKVFGAGYRGRGGPCSPLSSWFSRPDRRARQKHP